MESSKRSSVNEPGDPDEPTVIPIGLVFVASLGLVHVHAGRLRWIETVSARQWFSFGSGVSMAYIFIDVLPILQDGQAVLHQKAIVGNVPNLAYLVGLIGLSAFYSLEVVALRSRKASRKSGGDDCTAPSVFWLHLASFALYNGLLGYLLSDAEHQGLLACTLLFFALLLHFVVNDYALRSHHRALYDRYGRWCLAVAVLAGYLIGRSYELNEPGIAVLWAFVAGGLILNVIKDELPGHQDTSLVAFLVGMIGYSGLLLTVAH